MPADRTFDDEGETIQLYGLTEESQQIYVYATDYGDVTGDVIAINGTEYIRRYAVFDVSVAANYSINLWGNYKSYADIACPKLTMGNTPDPDRTVSQMKQTAKEIDLSVRDDLGEVGININGEKKTIHLSAEHTTIDGDLSVPKVISETDKAITAIIGGYINMSSKENGTRIEFGIDEGGNAVLNYYLSDGRFAYGLGPNKIYEQRSQAEEIRLTHYIIGESANGGYDLMDNEIKLLYEYVFKRQHPAVSKYVYRYYAKITSDVYSKGEYCDSVQDAQTFDLKYFKEGFTKTTKLSTAYYFDGVFLEVSAINDGLISNNISGYDSDYINYLEQNNWTVLHDNMPNLERKIDGDIVKYYNGNEEMFEILDGMIYYQPGYDGYAVLNLITEYDNNYYLLDPLYSFPSLQHIDRGNRGAELSPLYINKQKLKEIVGTL